MFATDPDTVARRASAFFGYSGRAQTRYWLGASTSAPKHQQLPIPEIAEGTVRLDAMSVTVFKQYLECPYRFYLSRVLHLESVDDQAEELDAASFGSQVHTLLEQFGTSDLRNSTDADQIRQFLRQSLDAWLKELDERMPAVRIQAEQIWLRLDRFAQLQARRASEGWQILAVEKRLQCEIEVDGEPFTLKGMIDRIDIRDQSEIAIWDYKTSNLLPHNAHFKKNKGWINLQLPLYRYLARALPELAERDLNSAQLGYILLPKKIDKVSFATAAWDSNQLAQADEVMREVVRNVRAGRFWPPAETAPEWTEALAGICQDHVFERWAPNPIEMTT